MNNVHGLIYANHTFPGLEALGSHRTGASLPFCGRYRLIDFALSGMRNAGVRNLGVIMQKGYQSLMEHLGNGRSWDLSVIPAVCIFCRLTACPMRTRGSMTAAWKRSARFTPI